MLSKCELREDVGERASEIDRESSGVGRHQALGPGKLDLPSLVGLIRHQGRDADDAGDGAVHGGREGSAEARGLRSDTGSGSADRVSE